MSDPGYSGTPLWKKLAVKPSGRVLTIAAPIDFELAELPPGASVAELADEDAHGSPGDVLLAFFSSRAELAAEIARLGELILPAGAAWIAWPRRAGGHESDIREQDIRDLALPLGLVDVKVAALDRDWSGLRLVWRKDRRHT